MTGKFEDLTGRRFGRQVVLARAPGKFSAPGAVRAQAKIYWQVRCDCGNVRQVLGTSLRHKGVQSCGCARTPELVGQTFARLQVISLADNQVQTSSKIRTRYHCRCACGKECVISAQHLISGNTKSCGCWRKDRFTKHGAKGRWQRTTEYTIWTGIKQRTSNPSAQGYAEYGGRGITLCARWFHSFPAFLADMGRRPAGTYSLELLDPTQGQFAPGACRWVTRSELARRWRTNCRIRIGEEERCLAEWARISRLPRSTIKSRLKLGWPPARAVFEKVRSVEVTELVPAE